MRAIVEKISCSKCGHFVGLVTKNAKTMAVDYPIFDSCPNKDGGCPMKSHEMMKHQPPPSTAYRCGTSTGPQDEDANGGWSQVPKAYENELGWRN